MVYVELSNGTRIKSPAPSKSGLGMELFMRAAQQPGAKLVMLDLEMSITDVEHRLKINTSLIETARKDG